MFPHVITTNWSHVRFGLLDLNDMSVYLESRRTTWTLFMHCPKYLHNDSVLQKKKRFFTISKVKIILTRFIFVFLQTLAKPCEVSQGELTRTFKLHHP